MVLNNEADLYKMYEIDSQKQADKFSKQQHRTIAPDSFYEWIIKRGICPYGVINKNSKYWIELMSIYDTDMGLTMPTDYTNLSAVFFDVLRIYRESRPAPKEG